MLLGTPEPTPRNIRSIRLNLKWSQQQCGNIFGVTRFNWSRWESGAVSMSPERWVVFLLIADQHPVYKLVNKIEALINEHSKPNPNG